MSIHEAELLRENLLHDLAQLIKGIVRTLDYKNVYSKLVGQTAFPSKLHLQIARDYASYAIYLLYQMQESGGFPDEDEFRRVLDEIYPSQEGFNQDKEDNVAFFNEFVNKTFEFRVSLPSNYRLQPNSISTYESLSDSFFFKALKSPQDIKNKVPQRVLAIKDIQINPAALGASTDDVLHADILKAFLDQNKDIKYFPQGDKGPNGKLYNPIELNGVVYKVKLEKSLVWRARKEERFGDRWEVFDKNPDFLIGETSGGTKVYESLGTLRVNDSRQLECKANSRVIKMQPFRIPSKALKEASKEAYEEQQENYNSFHARTKHEQKMSERIGHLHYKPITSQITTDTRGSQLEYSISVMDKIPGMTLRKYLETNKELSDQNKIDISTALLTRLTYLHSPPNRILHCDIKPENIMIHESDGEYTVRFIDFDSASDKPFKASTPIGTMGYSSYEALNGSSQVDEKSDIFSLGRCIGEVWGAAPQPSPNMVPNIDLAEYQRDKIFGDTSTVPKPIQDTLKLMDSKEKDNRPSSSDALIMMHGKKYSPQLYSREDINEPMNLALRRIFAELYNHIKYPQNSIEYNILSNALYEKYLSIDKTFISTFHRGQKYTPISTSTGKIDKKELERVTVELKKSIIKTYGNDFLSVDNIIKNFDDKHHGGFNFSYDATTWYKLLKIATELKKYKGSKKFISENISKLDSLVQEFDSPDGPTQTISSILEKTGQIIQELQSAEDRHYEGMSFFKKSRKNNSTFQPLLTRAKELHSQLEKELEPHTILSRSI